MQLITAKMVVTQHSVFKLPEDHCGTVLFHKREMNAVSLDCLLHVVQLICDDGGNHVVNLKEKWRQHERRTVVPVQMNVEVMHRH